MTSSGINGINGFAYSANPSQQYLPLSEQIMSKFKILGTIIALCYTNYTFS